MNPTDLAQEAIGPATVGGFSFLELFMQAHLVVQLVMAGLGGAFIFISGLALLKAGLARW